MSVKKAKKKKPGNKEHGKKLTPKQAVFVQEYLIDLNATRAAEAAGYSKKKQPKQSVLKT